MVDLSNSPMQSTLSAAAALDLPSSSDESECLDDFSSGEEEPEKRATTLPGGGGPLRRLQRMSQTPKGPQPQSQLDGLLSGLQGLSLAKANLSKQPLKGSATGAAPVPPSASASDDDDDDDDLTVCEVHQECRGLQSGKREQNRGTREGPVDVSSSSRVALALPPPLPPVHGPGPLVLGERGEFVMEECLRQTLYPHQLEGIQWLWSLQRLGRGGILADDMCVYVCVGGASVCVCVLASVSGVGWGSVCDQGPVHVCCACVLVV